MTSPTPTEIQMAIIERVERQNAILAAEGKPLIHVSIYRLIREGAADACRAARREPA